MQRRKNILFLTNRVPFPPDKGDKIRTFHQLDHLALSHNVYCACFVDSARDATHARALDRWCAGVIALPWGKRAAVIRAARGWLAGSPLTTAVYRDKRMLVSLSRWAAAVEFDVVVAFSASMAPYALEFPAKRRVLDLCDVDSQKWLDYGRDAGFLMSWAYKGEGGRLRAFEKECVRRFDATVLIADREREILDPGERCSRLHVIPNGTTMCASRPAAPSDQGPVVGFLGAMDYRPNVQGMCWFVEEVWPRILAESPEARLLIVGRRPTWRVRRLARVAGVCVTGEVDDPRKYLARFRVMVAPLQIARGLQNKVLEAMAMRRPVVATPAVAGGLQVEAGHNILVAGEADTFAEKVIELCRFDGLCDKIGDGGYRCVATYYGWAETLQRYERVVLGLPVPAAIGSTTSVSRSERKLRLGRSTDEARSGSTTRAGATSAKHDATGEQRGVRSPFAVMFRGDVQAWRE
ncbi:MAG: TIGR03087 family PEP-CTERM/XrtA system glycosyltransferase [Phycisphaerae bacterium]|nr:TIGR03087 family PEP-CTERM/XrtA system glycosyltransferase [Phycisphaerae bacterium]